MNFTAVAIPRNTTSKEQLSVYRMVEAIETSLRVHRKLHYYRFHINSFLLSGICPRRDVVTHTCIYMAEVLIICVEYWVSLRLHIGAIGGFQNLLAF